MSQVLTAAGGVRAAPAEAEELVEIPDGAVVSCPIKEYSLVPVSRCVDCKLFGGLEDRFPNGPQAFVVRYIHKCFGAPVKRTMQTLAKG